MTYTTTSSEYQHLGEVVMRKKKMKKPDRFERMVDQLRLEHLASPYAVQIPMEAWQSLGHNMLKRMRREHAWRKRMVQAELLPETAKSSQKVVGWNQALECILEQLEQRRK